MPDMFASGYRSASTAVEFPGPQPRSMARFGEASGTWASKSREGLVRSFRNLAYCFADQSSSLARGVVVEECFVDMVGWNRSAGNRWLKVLAFADGVDLAHRARNLPGM